MPKPGRKPLTPRTPPPRRTRAAYDAERSAATRERILEVTFDCLHELGHARTSTVEVCRRGGLPRGTLLHHFPDRATLLASAVEHLFERRLDEFVKQFERLAAGRGHARPDAATIDLLWKTVNAPSTVVWIELVVAARTDRDLHRALTKMARGFDAKIQATFARLFPGENTSSDASPIERHRVPFTFALMNGLVLDRMSGFEARVPDVLEALHQLAELGAS